MWPRRDLIDLFGIEHPILQAPMAGPVTPDLIAAVGAAGGLGGLGCGETPTDELAGKVGAIRAATNAPFNINSFIHPPPRPEHATEAALRGRVAPYFEEMGLGPPPALPRDGPAGFGPERLEAALDLRLPVVSFHFGLPDAESVARLRANGSVVLSSATSVAEARAVAAAGVAERPGGPAARDAASGAPAPRDGGQKKRDSL